MPVLIPGDPDYQKVVAWREHLERQRLKVPLFVAVKLAVMRGSEHIATAVSKTMAKRIANALNRHTTNSEGV